MSIETTRVAARRRATRLTHVARFAVAATAAAALGLAAPAAAQSLEAPFDVAYEVIDLGSVPGLPTPYGGVTFKAGDPDTLLIGGAANSASAAIYEVALERGCDGGVVGFIGDAVLLSTAPNIDGGLAYGPDGVLFYTAYPFNDIGQILPGSTVPDRIIDLTELGVSSSTGTLQFVPPGFPGAGSLKIGSFNTSEWFDAAVSPAGDGTFDIVDVTFVNDSLGGPEGLVYISDANPEFAASSALVSHYGGGRVDAYEVDADGNLVLDTVRTFISGLTGAEGAAIDPATGEFVFSTFGGGNRVIIVRGFGLACPADVAPDGGDGEVGFSDLLEVLSAWGESCTGPDINRSGDVDFADVLAVIAAWGPCPSS